MRHSIIQLGLGLLACHFAACQFPAQGTTYDSESCPIDSVTASAAVGMIIWPQNGTDTDGVDKARDGIVSLVGNSSDALSNYTSQTDGLIMWYAYINDEQACAIANVSGVAFVFVDGMDPDAELLAAIPSPETTPTATLDKRAQAYSSQTPSAGSSVVTELRVISQPSTVPTIDNLPNYVYPEEAGTGTYIYMVEDGINTAPPDLTGRVDPQYIWGANALRDNPGEQDDSEDGHATCAASKAGGTLFGASKSATLIAAKLTLSSRDIATIFDQVATDIRTRGIQKKAVVNMSWGMRPRADRTLPRHWLSMIQAIKRITQLDVPVVAGAGNARNDPGRSAEIDLTPQKFSSQTIPIINVGSVIGSNGYASGFSQIGPYWTLSAVGEAITCSPPTGEGVSAPRHSPIAAPPSVAGVLATFLSLDPVPFDTTDGQVAINALEFMKNTASWRREDDADLPNVLWNLVTEDQNPPSS